MQIFESTLGPFPGIASLVRNQRRVELLAAIEILGDPLEDRSIELSALCRTFC